MLGLIAGYGVALLKGPTYKNETIISAKESVNSNMPNLSNLGMIGGMVASQLNVSQNPGLDKIDLILDSKIFNAKLIEKYNLLPSIYKQAWPEDYKKYYDSASDTWNDSFQKPNLLSIGSFLKSEYLKKEIKAGVMKISVESKDSTFSDTLISKYLDYLNYYIKTNVEAEAKENLLFLENQLLAVADPFLREKLQNMIASELEKSMLVSKQAYELIDPPFRYVKFKELKIYPLVFGAGLFSLITIILFVMHALRTAPKTTDDVLLLNKIKTGIFKLKI